MTDNKLQLNKDKTEALLFNSSKLQDPPTSLFMCQTTVTFTDSVRNLGFYLDKELSMKEHINFICQTSFFEPRLTSAFQHNLSVDAIVTLVVSLVLSRIDHCNSLLDGLPLFLISKLQRVQNSAVHLVVCASSTCHTNSHTAQLVTHQNSYFLQNCLHVFQCHQLHYSCLSF